jgi:hypothetical protein
MAEYVVCHWPYRSNGKKYKHFSVLQIMMFWVKHYAVVCISPGCFICTGQTIKIALKWNQRNDYFYYFIWELWRYLLNNVSFWSQELETSLCCVCVCLQNVSLLLVTFKQISPLRPKHFEYYTIYKFSPYLKKTQHFCLTDFGWLVVFGEVSTIYSENFMNRVNMSVGPVQNYWLLNQVVCICLLLRFKWNFTIFWIVVSTQAPWKKN